MRPLTWTLTLHHQGLLSKYCTPSLVPRWRQAVGPSALKSGPRNTISSVQCFPTASCKPLARWACEATLWSRSKLELATSPFSLQGEGACHVLFFHPSYLGQVFGNATPTVSIWDLRVLQVHDPLAHILVQQDSPVMTS